MAYSGLKQSLRILLKEKRITLVNMTGLSISLASALLILLWVEHELSYDRFHQEYKQLYKVEEDQYYSGKEPYHVNVTPYVSGPVWKEEIPEITDQCRMAFSGGQLFTRGDQKFFEDGILAVDSSFFRMFGFKLRYGDPAEVLRSPGTMVITEKLASKYFGKENPVGKTITLNRTDPYTISGVAEDPPKNTVLGFNVLLPWESILSTTYYSDSWGSNSIRTFVKLEPKSIDTVVNRKLTEVTDIHKENNTIDYMVAPVSGIHLHSYFGYGKSTGAVLYVFIFSAIAGFVLLIACINFMNLSTARSTIRAREIGLKKVNGASRIKLVRQHMSESFIQTFISTLLAFLLVLLLLGKFNTITGKDIRPADLFSLPFLLGVVTVMVLASLLAGIYPSFYLSSLRPVNALREQSGHGSGSGILRKVLVVFQFSLAILLISASFVATRQLNFMRNADLGFQKDDLLHIVLQGDLNNQFEMLRSEFLKSPGITGITASMQAPYMIGSNSSGIEWEGKDPEMNVLVSFTGVHYDFLKTMGIRIAEGRDFSEEYPSDMYADTTANFVINRTLAHLIGKENVLGMPIRFLGASGKVVGIFDDYHFKPLNDEIEPMALAPVPPEELNHMIIRLSGNNPSGTLRFIEDRWEELLPQYPLEYNYVSDRIHDLYRSEERLSSLFRIFTFVAIIIACLGLFALSSFTAQRRTREIGIRKTMGAESFQITFMMIRDFSLYILISLVIALPAAWFIANWWLDEFSFRINLRPDLFLMPALITVAVSVLTVLFHAIRSARTNPVEALRYE